MTVLGIERRRRNRQPPRAPRSAARYPLKWNLSMTREMDDQLYEMRRQWDVPKTYMARACIELVMGSAALSERALRLAVERLRSDDELAH